MENVTKNPLFDFYPDFVTCLKTTVLNLERVSYFLAK